MSAVEIIACFSFALTMLALIGIIYNSYAESKK
jgi:hypothetical protein